MSGFLLEMRGIVKEFSGVRALDGIDLAVRPDECVGLCNENGAGKSTMMKVLSAVYPYGSWNGRILWDGQELRASSIRETEAAGIVIIHQELMLVPQLSVAENIFLGHEPLTRTGLIDFDAMIARATVLMAELKMQHINVARPVSDYRGGEQQLIEIAKALNKNARLLILDEPTRGVDVGAKYEIYRLSFALARTGAAVIMVSSEMPEVLGIADRDLVIGEGELRGNFVNDGLAQEQVLSAAITPLRRAARSPDERLRP